MINKRAQLHDNLVNYLSINAYNFFGGNIHLIDPQIAALRELLKQQLPIEQKNKIWNSAIEQNNLYKKLLEIFGPSIHNELFIKKFGDFVLELNSVWHIIEVKTSARASGVYYVNFDCFAVLRRIPLEVRKYIHPVLQRCL